MKFIRAGERITSNVNRKFPLMRARHKKEKEKTQETANSCYMFYASLDIWLGY